MCRNEKSVKKPRLATLRLTFIVVAFSIFSVDGQQTPEPYRESLVCAVAAMKAQDFEAAVKLYTDAINLFPKIDAYTPKSKVPDPSG